MKTTVGCKTVCKAFALVLVAALGSHQAWSSEPLGTRAWDPSQIPIGITLADHEYIGVYGDVRVQNLNSAIIIDKDYPRRSIAVDIRQLKATDQRRLGGQCALKACSGIVLGFMVHGKLEAMSVIPFLTSNAAAASPILVSTGALQAPAPTWHCRNRLRCT